jgi:hypothetical protein
MLSAVSNHNEPLRRRRLIRENLERLRSCAEMDQGKAESKNWYSLLELSGPQLERINSYVDDIPTSALERVAAEFKIDPQALLGESIDFREIAIRHSRGHQLPGRFMIGAFGRRRATIGALDFLEKKSGWRTRRDVFRHFKVNEAMFSNSMDPISMRFMTDVCTYLVKAHGYTKNDLYQLGTNIQANNRGTIVGNVFSSCRGPDEIYERFFGDMMKFFELNCEYFIVKVDNERCVIDVLSRSEVAEALRVKHLGNVETCAFKAGIFSSLTGFLGMPFAGIRELSCVHRGDASCRYELNYPRSSKPKRHA